MEICWSGGNFMPHTPIPGCCQRKGLMDFRLHRQHSTLNTYAYMGHVVGVSTDEITILASIFFVLFDV
jgi:hypothetical protein